MRMFDNDKNIQKKITFDKPEPILLSKAVLKIIAGGSQGCALGINPPKKRRSLFSFLKRESHAFQNPCG